MLVSYMPLARSRSTFDYHCSPPRSRCCVIQLLAATPETVLCTLLHRFGPEPTAAAHNKKASEQTVINFLAARERTIAVDAGFCY